MRRSRTCWKRSTIIKVLLRRLAEARGHPPRGLGGGGARTMRDTAATAVGPGGRGRGMINWDGDTQKYETKF